MHVYMYHILLACDILCIHVPPTT